jgi:hypothetical protein
MLDYLSYVRLLIQRREAEIYGRQICQTNKGDYCRHELPEEL